MRGLRAAVAVATTNGRGQSRVTLRQGRSGAEALFGAADWRLGLGSQNCRSRRLATVATVVGRSSGEAEPLVTETELGLLSRIQGAAGNEKGTVAGGSRGLLRLELPGPVAVGQAVDVGGGASALVLRFDKKGAVAALLSPGPAPPAGSPVELLPGLLALRRTDFAAGVTFATVHELLDFSGEASASLLGLPAMPPPPQRRPVQRRLPCGLAAAELLLPLGEGQRVGFAGPPGSGKSSALRMLVASQAPDTAVVFAALRPRASLEKELAAAGLAPTGGAPKLVLHTDPHSATPAERYLLVLTAFRVAHELTRSHRHVLLALDDLTGFAEAAAELTAGASSGALPLPAAQVVAALLDAAGNLEVAGGRQQALSVAAVFDLDPEDELPPLPRELWRTAEPSLDVCLNFSARLAAGGVLPAIHADQLLAGSHSPRYQAPLLRALRSEFQALLLRSRELQERLEMGKQLGLHAELQDVEELGSAVVARALLAHSVPRTPRELAVLVCSSVVFYFPRTRPPSRTEVAKFQAAVLKSISTSHPDLWEALGSSCESAPTSAESAETALETTELDGRLLRHLGEALLAHRFEFELTRPGEL